MNSVPVQYDASSDARNDSAAAIVALQSDQPNIPEPIPTHPSHFRCSDNLIGKRRIARSYGDGVHSDACAREGEGRGFHEVG